MLNRIASTVTLLGLLSLLGCGQMHRSVAPETETVTGSLETEPASLAKLDAAETALGSDDRNDDDDDGDDRDSRRWEERARPIRRPTVITKSGDYRLVSDLKVAAGDGIVIRADNVRLTLGDYGLRGPGNKEGRGIVVDGARNVLVRGGHVRRFGVGIAVMGSSQCRVQRVDVKGGDETADPPNGNPPQIGILLVNSSRTHVSRNRLRDVNLGIFVRGGDSYQNAIRRNEVVAGAHGLLGICYNPAPGAGPAGPRNDLVSRNVLNRFNTGIQTSAQSMNNVFRSNTIRYFTSAYEDLNGSNVFTQNRSQRITP